ncbi:MAG TPA: YifB family Mg chelatase-like AAA ATPase [Solirubrobacterales bacterium]|nr:YifB family Mg chelatase-like AAA ATPase [Solirubrobacterales bacterium]
MLATARTFTLLGVSAHEVIVEVDVHRGLPVFSLVGLPDAAVRESRERVRAALTNSNFEFPLQRITANLAPADLPKAGPGLDLAIAAALIAAAGQLPPEGLERWCLAGELALDGAIRPVPGVLAMAEEARRRGAAGLAVAADNAAEAALIEGLPVAPLNRLDELPPLARGELEEFEPSQVVSRNGAAPETVPDLSDLRGQPALRRLLEVAAAGGHSILITGPPGAGKSLAARRLPSLLPPLDPAEAIEVTRIASVCGKPPPPGRLAARPFRAPHHTISAAGLVGGGNPPRPGEVTLAHGGVLFLDELGEFSRSALEALRQPLEEGRVWVARVNHSVELPCRFMLVAAANPCPCGRGEDSPRCSCTPPVVRGYRAKLSGALADRIDVTARVDQPSSEAMDGPAGESSEAVRERVLRARELQALRLGPGRVNASMTPVETRRCCRIGREARDMLADGHARLGLSGRGHERVLRVARTIADLVGAERIDSEMIGEALSMRRRNSEP